MEMTDEEIEGIMDGFKVWREKERGNERVRRQREGLKTLQSKVGGKAANQKEAREETAAQSLPEAAEKPVNKIVNGKERCRPQLHLAATGCHRLSQAVTGCHRLSQAVTGCC